MTTDLTQSGILMRVSIGTWDGFKLDKQITAETAERYGADEDAGVWSKRLIRADSQLKFVKKKRNEARNFFYFSTLPWFDNGDRLLTSEAYPKTRTQLNRLQDEFNQTLELFLDEYPSLVEDARQRLGGTFKATDYPPVEELRSKFYFTISVRPVPIDTNDWRIGLGAKERNALIAEITESEKNLRRVANEHLWQRVYDAVAHVVERMTGMEKDKKGDMVYKTFRDSLITNIADLIDILKVLNINEDKNLEQMAKRLKIKLASLDLKLLRTDKATRLAARKEAQAIMEEITVNRRITLATAEVAPVEVEVARGKKRKIKVA